MGAKTNQKLFCRILNFMIILYASAEIVETGSDIGYAVTVNFSSFPYPVVNEKAKIVCGGSNALTCKAEGYPLPDIVISRNGMDLPLEQIKNTVTKEIHDATSHDEGMYCCTASNMLGNSSGCFSVAIKCRNSSWTIWLGAFSVITLMLIMPIIHWKRNKQVYRPKRRLTRNLLIENEEETSLNLNRVSARSLRNDYATAREENATEESQSTKLTRSLSKKETVLPITNAESEYNRPLLACASSSFSGGHCYGSVAINESTLAENARSSPDNERLSISSLHSAESSREEDAETSKFSVLNKANEAYTEALQSSPESVDMYVNEQRVTCTQKSTVSDNFGKEGGNLALSSYDVSLTIPPGAITSTAPLDVRLSLFVSDDIVCIGRQTVYVGLIELLPHETIFKKAVTLRYRLKHHHKPTADSIKTEYRFFYGEGLDPSETYRFVGSLDSTCRHVSSYKGTMNFYLQDDCLELSTLSFCRHCCIIRFGRFGITISFFVRPQGVFAGEQKWEIRTIISCSCPKNLKTIRKKQKRFGFSLVDERSLCCRIPFVGCRQKLEFFLGKNDDYTSNFSLCSENGFSGDELRFVVEGEEFRDVQNNSLITCSDQVACTQSVKFVYKYYESSVFSLYENVLKEDKLWIRLESEASSDYRSSDSDFPSNTSESESKKRRTDAAPELASSTEESDEDAFEIRGCGNPALASAAAQHQELMRIKRRPTSKELLNLSKRLLNDWKNVARQLGVPNEDIMSIENDYRDEVANEQPFQMLLKWAERQGNAATVGILCAALITEGKAQTATKVF